MNEYISFRCLPVYQPIGIFYIGAIKCQDLVKIAYSDIRRLRAREVEEFVGIERPLIESRVNELKQYVCTIDASFPTSIVLNIRSKNAIYNPKNFTMRIRRAENIAKILDGQHRIAGLEEFNEAFQLNVTIFIDMDIADQAMVFSTINLKQTKVQKSLVYDLYEYARSRSPEKTCHNIAKLLNKKSGSPFEGKIKILGRAGGAFETLTQATFVERLLPYISDNPMQDRDLSKRGKKIQLIKPPLTNKLIFRNMFVKEKDAEIARILFNYFKGIAKKWNKAWFSREKSDILTRTTGFTALMRLLRDVYISFGKPDQVISALEFEKIFSSMKLKDSDFTTEKYNPGGGGQTALYKDFLREWQKINKRR